jgi:hypothetical protein
MISLIKTAYQKLLNIFSPEIIPHPKNMNQHSEEQIKRLADLILYQGQRLPIIISKRSGFIVAGHGRWEAIKILAKDHGWDKIAVDFQDFENEAQEYAFMTSDNAIAEWSTLDLSMVNTEMLEFGPEFNIDLLGIKDFTIEPVEKFDLDEEFDKTGEDVADFTDGVRKAIQIDFELEHYDEASEIISTWRKKGAYVGLIILTHLKERLNEID